MLYDLAQSEAANETVLARSIVKILENLARNDTLRQVMGRLCSPVAQCWLMTVNKLRGGWCERASARMETLPAIQEVTRWLSTGS